jgi:glycerol kinase
VAYQCSSAAGPGGEAPPAVYALEGSVAYSGAAIQWLRDNLQVHRCSLAAALPCTQLTLTTDGACPDNHFGGGF